MLEADCDLSASVDLVRSSSGASSGGHKSRGLVNGMQGPIKGGCSYLGGNKTTACKYPYAPLRVRTNTYVDPYKLAEEAEPLRLIPRRLFPSSPPSSSASTSPTPTKLTTHSRRLLPPVLHIGWSIDERRLLQWCSDEGFDRFTTDINGHVVFDYQSTTRGALSYFAERAGVSGWLEPYLQLTVHRSNSCMVAVESNYGFGNVQEYKDRMDEGLAIGLQRLGRVLADEGLLVPANASGPRSRQGDDATAPRWFLDYKQWQWIFA